MSLNERRLHFGVGEGRHLRELLHGRALATLGVFHAILRRELFRFSGDAPEAREMHSRFPEVTADALTG